MDVAPTIARVGVSGRRLTPVLRRRLGIGLLVYGVVGLALFVAAIAVLVTSPVAAQLDQSAATVSAATRLLERAQTVLADSAATSRSASSALDSTSASSRAAAEMMTRLAATLRDGSSSLRVDIFGSRPFASVADGFEQTAGQADGVAADLRTTSVDVAAVSTQLTGIAADLDELNRTVATQRAGLPAAGTGDPGVLQFLIPWLVIVAAWLGLQALACALTGWRLLRSTPPAG